MTLPLLISCTQLQVGNTLYGTAIGLTAADWFQTREIVRDYNNRSEANPILGPHPTYAQVDSYFPAIIALEILSYPLVKPSVRPYLYGVITLFEGYVVGRNASRGLHMNFAAFKF